MRQLFDFIPDIERAKITTDISDAIVEVLSSHVGACNAIGGKNMLTVLRRAGHHIDQRRMRLAISTLRRRGHLICSAPGINGGYYMPASEAEFETFLNTEYLAKIKDMSDTVSAMRSAARRQFTPNQLDLL